MTKVLFEMEPKQALAYVLRLLQSDKPVLISIIDRKNLIYIRKDEITLASPMAQVIEALLQLTAVIYEPKKFAVRINVPDNTPFKG